MTDSGSWKHLHRPELRWAPHGLPGQLRALPGWMARAVGEARVVREVAGLPFDGVWRDGDVPTGDGRPVLVVPGFAFGDDSLVVVHQVLARHGWVPKRSGIVANLRCSDRTVQALIPVAESLVEADGGRRLTVVGQSRGGMIARGLGALRPDLVQRVVSLGGALNDEFAFYEIPMPLVSVLQKAHALDAHLAQKGCLTAACTCDYMQASGRPMPADVELVSLYSTSDGIVDWRSGVVPGARNIEVPGSHLGMGLHAAVLRTLLDVLAEPAPDDVDPLA